MRLEQMTVHLRSRSSWEAMELGFALVRREASVIWKAWLLVTLPLFLLLNFAAWSADMLWSAWLLMLWLKPVFDRIPLFVISRSVFGATPGIGETLRAQLDWGWRPMLAYLTWRRFSPARSLLMPIELLEGGKGFRLRERRRVLGGAVYGNAALLTFVCLLFETALIGGCIFTIALYVRPELLPETLRTAWSMIGHERPWWVTFAGNAFAWLAVSVIEPFFVGAGFGLYLNRRTQIEAWDVEIAFRKLRARLAAAATPLALVLVLGLALLGTGLLPAHAQQAGGSAAAADAKPDTAPT
ncbi:MAG TPA: DUF4129 domain-containing protein, partial [Pseudoxanthomonas sp.]|nr:DUF4129 domain-containing protein [Pseudoxanthomonas sp.]